MILIIQTVIQTRSHQAEGIVFADWMPLLPVIKMLYDYQLKCNYEKYKHIRMIWTDKIYSLCYYSYDYSLTFLKLNHDHSTWELVTIYSWQVNRERWVALILPTSGRASCADHGRSQSKAKDDCEAGMVTSQHTFPSQPKRGIRQYPFEKLVSQGIWFW